jgi:hypothetical protein
MINEGTSIALEPLFFEGIQVEYSVDKLRLLVSAHRQGFSSDETRAFLTLYAGELKALLDKTIRDFLKNKVG